MASEITHIYSQNSNYRMYVRIWQVCVVLHRQHLTQSEHNSVNTPHDIILASMHFSTLVIARDLWQNDWWVAKWTEEGCSQVYEHQNHQVCR